MPAKKARGNSSKKSSRPLGKGSTTSSRKSASSAKKAAALSGKSSGGGKRTKTSTSKKKAPAKLAQRKTASVGKARSRKSASSQNKSGSRSSQRGMSPGILTKAKDVLNAVIAGVGAGAMSVVNRSDEVISKAAGETPESGEKK